MAFCFKKKESLSKAIRRLGRARIEDALECLAECNRPDAIHCARKDIKKVRALLRLAQAGIRKKDCRRLAGLLRQIAKELAETRDAFVILETLKKLSQHFKGQLASGALRHVRQELRVTRDHSMKRFARDKKARLIKRKLRQTAKELGKLRVSGQGWNLIHPGISNAYCEGQHRYQAALDDPSAENFHEWRKCAKVLWYQLILLRPIWPEQMDSMAHELEQLEKGLGDAHDLDMLREAIEDFESAETPAEFETLKGLIDERQRRLRAAALLIGRRFYGEEPPAFCDRLGAYWRTWRREKKPGIELAQAVL